ncbi:MAG: hypothetical protein HWN65_08380 [Candidatus Helarchaeota archaeon]|nr:hypothetical protein [Candidatus Helarchaeota archaeon]
MNKRKKRRQIYLSLPKQNVTWVQLDGKECKCGRTHFYDSNLRECDQCHGEFDHLSNFHYFTMKNHRIVKLCALCGMD